MVDKRKVRTLLRLRDGQIKRMRDPQAAKAIKKGGYIDYSKIFEHEERLRNRSFSFIIPYMYSPEREELFFASLENLAEHIKDRDMEICVHEIGRERTLPDWHAKNYKYLFTNYDGIFNRAWALNVAAKHMATGDVFIFIDSDLIYTQQWFNEILLCASPAIAWGKMYYLNMESTRLYLEKDIFQPVKAEERKVRKPNIKGAAGGASFIPRKIFFAVHGIPEDFGGTWGGEDNAFMAKIAKYGYPVLKFKSTLYHMYHEHRTGRDMTILLKVKEMVDWSKEDWLKHTRNIKQWGERDHPKMHMFAYLSRSEVC